MINRFQVNKKNEKYDKLKELQEQAKAAKLGLYVIVLIVFEKNVIRNETISII